MKKINDCWLAEHSYMRVNLYQADMKGTRETLISGERTDKEMKTLKIMAQIPTYNSLIGQSAGGWLFKLADANMGLCRRQG